MGLSFRVLREQKLVVSTFTDAITDRALVSAYGRLFQEGVWQPGFDEVADLRGGDFTAVTSGGLEELFSLAEKALDGVPIRTAVIAPRDLPFGLGRLYEALAAESPEVVQVFREPAEALEWLGRPASILE